MKTPDQIPRLKFNKYMFSIPIFKFDNPKFADLLWIAPFLAVVKLVEFVINRDKEEEQ